MPNLRTLSVRSLVVLAVLAATMLAVAPRSSARPTGRTWTMQQLPAPAGGQLNGPNDINDRGDLVASVSDGAVARAVEWRKDRWTDLPPISADFVASEALHLNERGTVVGTSRLAPPWPTFKDHITVWTDGKAREVVPPDPTQQGGAASSVNDRGQVVGYWVSCPSDPADCQIRAFMWQRGRFVDLGAFGQDYAAAVDINDRGVIVGNTTESGSSPPIGRAFVRQPNGSVQFIEPLPGFGNSNAVALNSRGDVLFESFSSISSGPTWALWSNGRVSEIAVPGCSFASAADLNSSGLVVGTCGSAEGFRSFVWKAGGISQLLPVPDDAQQSRAFAVNNRGDVAGANQRLGSDAFEPVVWHPAPGWCLGTG